MALPKVRLGLALQLPFWVHANGTVESRLPTDPMFGSSQINGDSTSFDMTLPLMLRLGAELRAVKRLRIELGLDFEAWAMQDRFTITPHNAAASDPDALAAYAKLAGPAIAAAGGRFLARANAAKAYEAGVADRVVPIEFDSLERAVAAHEGAPYQAALKVLGKAVDRDLRIVEGLA